MKEPTHWWRHNVFHIELPNCIVNLRPGIKEGVDHIEILPNKYPGLEAKVEPDVTSIKVTRIKAKETD